MFNSKLNDTCLYRHERQVVYSPNGVPYYCNKCDAKALGGKFKVNQKKSFTKNVQRKVVR